MGKLANPGHYAGIFLRVICHSFTRFSGASSAMHANDRSLTMVDLFCCAGATARLVSEAGSEELRITVKEIGE